MRSPSCATAALGVVDALLRRGAPPSSILLVSSSWQQARLLEHIVDVGIPAGAYDLTCTSVWGLASRLLASASAGSPDGHRLLSRGAASAFFRRNLSALPLRRFRPANDPTRYAAALERYFESLRYAGVSGADFTGLNNNPSNSDDEQRRQTLTELAAAYATWLAVKRSGGAIDRSDVLASATSLLNDSSASKPIQQRDSCDWTHVIATDGHNLSPLALSLLRAAFSPAGSVTRVNELAMSSSGFEGAEDSAQTAFDEAVPPSVHICLDPHSSVSGPPGWGRTMETVLQRLMLASGHESLHASITGAVAEGKQRERFAWSYSLHSEDGASGHPAIVNAVSRSLSGATAAPSKSKRKPPKSQSVSGQPSESPKRPSIFTPADLTAIGADYAQTAATFAATPAKIDGFVLPDAFMELLGVPSTSDRHEAAARAVLAVASKLVAADIDASAHALTICVACRSMSQARSLHNALKAAVESSSFSSPFSMAPAASDVSILLDSSQQLADVEEVRTLLAALGCLAHPGDHRHVYNLATSPLYGVPIPLMAALLQKARQQQPSSAASLAASAAASDSDSFSTGGVGQLGGLRALIEAEAAPPSKRRKKEGDARRQPTTSKTKGAKEAAALVSSDGDDRSDVHHTPSALSLRRLLDDLDDCADAYARHRSAAAALARFSRRSGLAGALESPSNAKEEAAGTAIAALLQLCQEIEATAGGGPGASASAGATGPSRLLSVSVGRKAGGRQYSGIYKGSGGDTKADATGAASSGLPFLFSSLQTALLEEGAAVRHDNSAAAFSSSSSSITASVDLSDEDDATVAEELAPLLGGTAGPSSKPLLTSDGFEGAGGGNNGAVRCQDALEAATTVAIMTALDRARTSGHSAPARLHFSDFLSASSSLANSGSVPPITVVLTTERRALSHQYDVLVLPWAVDSTMPGPFFKPPLPYPEPLFSASRHLPGLVVSDGANTNKSPVLYLPVPRDVTEHEESARHRLRVMITHARRGVLFVAPTRTPSTPASSLRRSRFVNELFGPPPAVLFVKRNQQRLTDADESTSGDAVAPRQLSDGSATSSGARALMSLDSPFNGLSASAPSSQPLPPSPSSLLPLSFTSLSEYEWCPYRYYLSRVARLPPPQPVPAALLYGRALHEAVALLGRRLMQAAAQCGVSASQPEPQQQLGLVAAADVISRLVAEPDVRAKFASFLPPREATIAAMREAYVSTWRGQDNDRSANNGAVKTPSNDHLSVPGWQAAELEAEAVSAIACFYDSEMAQLKGALAALDGGASRPNDITLSLPAYIEHRFSYPLERAGVALTGVIDRADVQLRISGGDLPSASPESSSAVASSSAIAPALTPMVREFKTSMQWRDKGHLGRKGGDSKQLSLYAMALKHLAQRERAAAQEPQSQPPHPLLTALCDALTPQAVSLESIETGDVHRVDIGRKQTEDLVALLAKRAASISAGEFQPKASPVTCGICPFQLVCPKAFGVSRTVTAEAARAHREP